MVLRAIGLTFISIILIVSMFVSVVGISMQTLLYPRVYETTLEKYNFYEYLEERITNESGLPADFVSGKTKPILTGLMDDTLTYLRGERTDIDLKVDLSDNVKEYIETKTRELPVCKNDKEFIEENTIVCRPSILSTGQFIDLALKYYPQEFSKFTTIDLLEETGARDSLVKIRDTIHLVRQIIYGAIFTAIIMILLLILLTRKSFTTMTEWLDGDLLIVSFSLFALIYFVKDTFMSFVPTDPSIIQPVATGLATVIFDSVMVFSGIVAGVAVSIFVAWIVWHEIKRANNKRGNQEEPY